MISEADIRLHLRSESPWQIISKNEVASTMIEARRLGDSGCPGFTVVVAEQQTGGLGRLARPWYSPAGTGLWMTVILRPELAPEHAPWLTLASAVSVAEALRNLGFSAGIKWPNDILAATGLLARRKLCGIRAEMTLEGGKINRVNVGIGLNVNTREFPQELAAVATSLLQLNEGIPISRALCAANILERIEANCLTVQEGDFSEIRQTWHDYAIGLGEKVTLSDIDGNRQGLALGLDKDGYLLLEESPAQPPIQIISGDMIL